MRHLICCLFGIALFHGSFEQDLNSASFLNDGLKYIVQDMEKKKENVVHAETGIFTINKSMVSDFTNRRLYRGNTYTIVVFTDTRIRDFKLLVWKSDTAGRWSRYDSVNENDHARLNSKSVGDQEVIHVTPDEDREYSFQLTSETSGNTTGRYGVVIIAELAGAKKTTGVTGGGANGNGSNGSGAGGSTGNGGTTTRAGVNGGTNTGNLKTYLSCDYYSTIWLKKNAANKWVMDGDWTRTDESSLFVLNPEETVFEHTTPRQKSSYYVQSRKNEGKVYTYEVKSDVGNNYTFEVDLAQDRMDIMVRADNGRWYLLRRHLKRVWTE